MAIPRWLRARQNRWPSRRVEAETILERDALCIELHCDHDLLTADVLPTLQAALSDLAPRLASAAEVHAYERDKQRVVINLNEPDSLRDAVLAKGTERGATFEQLARSEPALNQLRRFGHTFVKGGDLGGFLTIRFDELAPARPAGTQWLWSNSVEAHISSPLVSGSPRAEWAQQFIEAMSRCEGLVWGAGYLLGEFASGNLDESADGIRAVGRDVRHGLPGLFWINVFGPAYLQLMDRERVLTAPANEIKPVGEAVLLRLYEQPEAWPHESKRKPDYARPLVLSSSSITTPAGPRRRPTFALGSCHRRRRCRSG